ncbi:MBL fold metallo-hydrolase [Aureimonas fodinaquatilis]|uniref:MBL fold metallo-hydrolase n=1 Tax=Aureimonas fodinaquatilis TaxID=2565783 RepID=A0A5B0DTV9_9HYPH|nr:MBL fold metallo-hydrolase [Aureimonas fodinaquatilis]KAA0969000.1 MBL fold metallo-hydrolase [Aureimonas fodinaquatilis]
MTRLTIYGARGSIPSAPDDPSEFGARTSCVSLEISGQLLVFDAGSGLVDLGRKLLQGPHRQILMFLSHAHYDHIIGLPYFAPLYDPAFEVTIHAGHMLDGSTCETVIRDFLRPPFHPVGVEAFRAKLNFVTFRPGDLLTAGPQVSIATHRLNHPNGAVGYRVSSASQSICYVTDHEHKPGNTDPALEDFVRNADLMVYDTNYTEADMTPYAGYGHSSPQEAIRLCQAANVGRLVLFHHSFKHSDEQLRAIEAEAQKAFRNTVSARAGMVLTLPGADLPAGAT